jgi:NAD(P)-dependent dehydrogenase (short-subunit alcohol dehydrogenase family)
MRVTDLLSLLLSLCSFDTLWVLFKEWITSFVLKFMPPRDLDDIQNTYRGKWCCVTGGTSGIGFSTARILAENGVNIVIASHDVKGGLKAKAAIKRATLSKGLDTSVEYLKCDLSSFESVVRCADDIRRLYPISLLINNAAVLPSTFKLTSNQQEELYQVTYLSHFLLTSLLWDTLNNNGPSRVVWVSSELHKLANSPLLPPKLDAAYNSLEVYSRAKLAIVMSVHEWHRRFVANGANVVINSVNPGAAATNILRYFPLSFIYPILMKLFLKSADKGSECSIFAALSPTAGRLSSRYISDCQDTASSTISYDTKLAAALWMHTQKALRPYTSRTLVKESGAALM